MKQIYLDSLEDELNYWSPIMEVKTITDTACDLFVNELFPYEKSSKEIKKDQYIKECSAIFYRTFMKDHNDANRQTGIEAEDEFFNAILDSKSDEELKNEYLNTALCQILNIVCMYVCDAANILKTIKKEFQEGEVITIGNDVFTDNKVFYYLCKCNYFLGLCKATHANNVGSKEQLKEKMIKLAEIKHQEINAKRSKDEITIKEIWENHNWKNYTKCAEHIFENNLVNRTYRDTYAIVSKVAKKK